MCLTFCQIFFSRRPLSIHPKNNIWQKQRHITHRGGGGQKISLGFGWKSKPIELCFVHFFSPPSTKPIELRLFPSLLHDEFRKQDKIGHDEMTTWMSKCQSNPIELCLVLLPFFVTNLQNQDKIKPDKSRWLPSSRGRSCLPQGLEVEPRSGSHF